MQHFASNRPLLMRDQQGLALFNSEGNTCRTRPSRQGSTTPDLVIQDQEHVTQRTLPRPNHCHAHHADIMCRSFAPFWEARLVAETLATSRGPSLPTLHPSSSRRAGDLFYADPWSTEAAFCRARTQIRNCCTASLSIQVSKSFEERNGW